jgi:hypothetical protein
MWKTFAAVLVGLSLSGCASLNQVSHEVSTYSLWPAERQATATTYSFERLPSQQAHPEQTRMLEEAAAPALEQAGFRPASDPASADVTVTVGARITAYERSPYDDPFWWHGGLYPYRSYRHPFFWGAPYGWRYGYPFYHPFYDAPLYEREVALLIRDRRSGQPLYEARVTNDGYSSSMQRLLSTMFEAALKDFPYSGTTPRRVITQIAPS